jgi:hypothetical protein
LLLLLLLLSLLRNENNKIARNKTANGNHDDERRIYTVYSELRAREYDDEETMKAD